ncbi:pentatricopeptide repeat-containing protein At5g39350, partial [Impatiens glandulifera]|uniref:pentatricopeptide repeat-containing protein At5g39350 n=1 Tax=Impatiens glandulifera TaxID=253017 RepID=UPI001FB06050
LCAKVVRYIASRSLYNTMIRMYIKNASPYNRIKLFSDMLSSGNYSPDNYTFPSTIKACGDISSLELGTSVHCLAVTSGVHLNPFVENCLLAMYMNCSDLKSARLVFNTMQHRCLVSWNTMISAYSRNGCPKSALLVFKQMIDNGMIPDQASLASVLPVCGYLKDLNFGRRVHALAEAIGLRDRTVVQNALMDMYVKCGSMNEAESVFKKMDEKDVISWTTMINGYALNNYEKRALMLCAEMQFHGERPNFSTISLLLSVCASLNDLKHGKCLHSWVLRHKLESDILIETALINMYSRCKRVNLSQTVFRNMPRKRTATWNSIISGYNQNGLHREAIILFKEMISFPINYDAATFSSLLPVYAALADLKPSMNIHCYLTKSGFLSTASISSTLIDIYSKCGNLDSALKVFDEINTKDKDIVCWSVVLSGCGKHGRADIALSLFDQMIRSGLVPNEVTFTSVLHACSHSGLVDDGLLLFNVMLKYHERKLHGHHFNCIIDLLGRNGRLEEAHKLIKKFEPNNHAILGAILGACVIHENVELGELTAKRLFELEPENTGNYVLLGKIYAAAGRWIDAENIRHMIDQIGLRKKPALSLI